MRRQRLFAGLLVVALLVAGGVVYASRSHKHSSTSPGHVTAATIVPGPFLARSSLGISTGVVLFNESVDQIDKDMSGIAALGAHWVRTSARWDSIEPSSASSDDWTKTDRIVTDAQAHGLQLIIDLNGVPHWAQPSTVMTDFPSQPQTYATFAAKLATRYKGKVAAYELGNEPNLAATATHPNPAFYVGILKAAYPAIKAADPDATVLTAGFGGKREKKGNIAGDTFLADLYRAGAKGFFDGVSYHPYTWPLTPSHDAPTGGWSRMLKARQTMVANGDGAKKIWVTEFGAPTAGSAKAVTPTQQAAMLADAYRLWSTYSWSGPLCWFDYRDKGNDTSTQKDFFGLYDSNGTPKLAAAQYTAVVHSIR